MSTRTWGSLLAIVLASCTASNEPDVGSLLVSVTTTGTNPDPDGYLIAIGQEPGEPIPAVGDITVDALPPGDYPAKLSGLAPNCFVTGTNPLTVKVTAGAKATATFAVSCPGAGTRVKVTTIATGTDFDPNGYMLTFGSDATRRVSTQGVTNLFITEVGPLTLTLGDVAPNCTPDPTNPTTITTALDTETPLTLKVACTALPRVVANVVSTGQDIDVDGYTVGLGSSDDYYGPSFIMEVPSNGTATSVAMQSGTYTVTVRGIASNCHLVSPGPTDNSIVVHNTGDVTLSVTVQCDPAKELAFVVGVGSGSEIGIGTELGTSTLLTSNAVADSNPAWSPDGTHLAFTSVRDGNNEIYLMNADGSDVRRLTNSVYADYQPTWSSDGTRIAFVSERDGNPEIYVMSADGSNPVRLTSDPGADNEPDWSHSGDRILFVSGRSNSARSIHVMNADGSGVVQLTSGTAEAVSPVWSPSSARVAFVQKVGGANPTKQLYVMSANGTAVRSRSATTSESTSLSWGADDRIAFTTLRCDDWFACYTLTQGLAILQPDGTVVQMSQASLEPAWRP